ncbi:MAG: ABC transporter permease [Christensenellales bacterium]|jgi:osmoprotectant transport system permease protein
MSLHVIGEHLFYVFFAVLFTIMAGVPIGVCAYLFKGARRIILTGVSILQTIPSLALIGMIMVIMGAGKHTIITGLVLYSLLPVVQNTYVGLNEVDPAIKEAAVGMGMTRLYRLIHVEMPIAFPLIFTGIRIATVTSVGVAVFAAFVGGGGLGSLIYNGIRIQNMRLIFSSTASLMGIAVLFDSVMGMVEKRLHNK